jgi:predicted neuraminidase
LGNINTALRRLKDAADHGWQNIDHTEQCVEFEPLHLLDQWNEIFTQIKKNQNDKHQCKEETGVLWIDVNPAFYDSNVWEIYSFIEKFLFGFNQDNFITSTS